MSTLVEQYIPLANKLAIEKKRSLPNCISFEELQSAAYMGLVEAASRFDESLGNSFSTFAYWRIVGEMQDYLREIGWGSRGSVPMQSLDAEMPSEDACLKDMIADKAVRNHSEFLEELMNGLPSLAKDIFEKYYFENMSLKEIGKLFKVSESRISQLMSEYKKIINAKWDSEDAYEIAA